MTYSELVVVEVRDLEVGRWDHGRVGLGIILVSCLVVSSPSSVLTLVLIRKYHSCTLVLTVEVGLSAWVLLGSRHWLRKHWVQFLRPKVLLSALRRHWWVVKLYFLRVLYFFIDRSALLQWTSNLSVEVRIINRSIFRSEHRQDLWETRTILYIIFYLDDKYYLRYSIMRLFKR